MDLLQEADVNVPVGAHKGPGNSQQAKVSRNTVIHVNVV